jgi:predicted Zn-dependent protease
MFPRGPGIGILAIALLLGACSTTTKPGAVDITRKQLLIVPASTVEQMAAVSFNEQNEKARSEGKLVTSGPELERLNQIAARLEQQAPVFRPDAAQWKWELALIDSPVLNASCGPGGKMTIYTGIVRKLDLSDDEIAMIIGHEMSHALREHGRERISQAAAQNAITSAALGAAQSREAQVKLANQFAEILYVLPNSRQNESEADRMGLELAARAGFDPHAAISVWQKMSEASKGSQPPEFLSTHPANESRIAELTALQPTVAPLYAAAAKR